MLTRRAFAVAATAIAVARPAISQDQNALATDAVRRDRATVPVHVNGVGPFRFAVDTAANASVIADDLIERLGLTFAGRLGMHTLVGREIVPAYEAREVSSGALRAGGARLAAGKRAAMAGLDGLLGADLLAESRLVLNFRGGERVRIARSAAPPRGFLDTLGAQRQQVVAAERGVGGLLIVPAVLGRASVRAVIDTGSGGTLLNPAAARAGRAIPVTADNGDDRTQIQSPTGEAATAQIMLARSLGVAGMVISNLPVAVGDFHTFRLLGLQDEPALLLGLDVFRLFSAVHIDLKRAEFSIRP